MKRLIIDISSILRACHFVGVDEENGYRVEFEGKQVQVNSAEHAYENFVASYKTLLNLTNTKPYQTIIVKDGVGSRQFRQALYPEYKAHRKPSPPELNKEYNTALDGVVDEVLALGGLVVTQDGMEADDVIAYLAQNLRGEMVIWSRDADMLALRNGRVHVYLKDTMDPEIHESCPSDYIHVYKALVGDSSDNLPGAKGFGPTAFAKLVMQFGFEGLDMLRDLLERRQLRRLAEDVAEFKPLQKVLDAEDKVYASYTCAKFYPHRVNTPVAPMTIEARPVLPRQDLHPTLAPFVGTKLLVTSMEQAAELLPRIHDSPYVALDIETSTPAESDKWVARILASKKGGRKKTMVDVIGSTLTGLSLTFGNNLQHTAYFPVRHSSDGNLTSSEVMEVVAAIPEDVPVVVHNANFELPVLYNEWGAWLDNVQDTRLMKSHVNENTGHGLKFCSKEYLRYDQVTYEDVTQGRKMCELTAQEAFDYACDDTICTAALYNRFLLTLELEGTLDSYASCDARAVYWVAESFTRGIEIDWDRLKQIEAEDSVEFERAWGVVREYLIETGWRGTRYEPFVPTPANIKAAFAQVTGQELDTRVRKLDKLIAEVSAQGAPGFADALATGDPVQIDQYLEQYFTGEPDFDVNKDDHLRELLYERWGLPIRFRTRVTDLQRKNGKKEGTPQADKYALDHAFQLDLRKDSQEYEILKQIRIMGQIQTRRELYYGPYPLLAHWKTGRIHAQLGQNMTVTRRFAPHDPNVNQLPKRGEGKRVREVIVAPAGWYVVAMDFSGQELRLAAELSQDEALLSCYTGDNKRDPHSLTGLEIAVRKGSEFNTYESFVANKSNPEVETLRHMAKGVNFGSQYLCRAPKLAKMLTTTVEDAQLLLDAKNSVYAGLEQWQRDTIAETRGRGYALTLLGGRRHLYDKLMSEDKWAQAEAERQAVNFCIQGSGAEMTKMSVNAMQDDGVFETYGVRFMMPVHDEVVCLVHGSALHQAIPEIHARMIRRYATMAVPLESEVSVGFNFGQMVKVGGSPTGDSISAALEKLHGCETKS